MFLTYLRRELGIRRRQTLVVVVGMALAIALVIVLNALAAGVRDAQAAALASVYGVGTDITVSQTRQPGQGGPQRFEFGSDAGTATDDGQRVSSSSLRTAMGKSSFDDGALTTVRGLQDVSSAAAVLSLENTTFNGELPDFSAGGGPGPGAQPPSGGADGAGGSAFDVDRFSVLGVDPASDAVGPLTTVSVTDGRGLAADDSNVALVDTAYAQTNGIAVGDTIDVGGTEVAVVGIVESSTGAGVSTGTDVFLPLATAQSIAGLDGQVSDIYVQASSGQDIDAVDAAIASALPDMTVSTQSDLAQSVSGSLTTAADLITKAGRWVSLVALAAAFLLAILFTITGVGRRTRELGTLKAIGWGNRRVVGQIAGESVATGLIGGAVGLVLGIAGVVAVNAMGITLSGSAAAADLPVGPGPGGGAFPGPGAALADAAAAATDIVINAPMNLAVVGLAIGLAVLGGLLAGAFGGRRAARLSPAEALRSVA